METNCLKCGAPLNGYVRRMGGYTVTSAAGTDKLNATGHDWQLAAGEA